MGPARLRPIASLRALAHWQAIVFVTIRADPGGSSECMCHPSHVGFSICRRTAVTLAIAGPDSPGGQVGPTAAVSEWPPFRTMTDLPQTRTAECLWKTRAYPPAARTPGPEPGTRIIGAGAGTTVTATRDITGTVTVALTATVAAAATVRPCPDGAAAIIMMKRLASAFYPSLQRSIRAIRINRLARIGAPSRKRLASAFPEADP